MKTVIKKIKNKLLITLDRWRGFFKISFEHGIPRLHVHEKYEKHVKWSLRFIALIGIATSVFSFQIWYVSLFFALFLVGLEQLFERIIFIFSSLFVSAIPEYKPEDWKGMVWGIPAKKNEPFIVGPLFSTQEVAHKIFECIRRWNDDESFDQGDNISLSVILEDEKTYSMYMYPGFSRKTMKEFHKKVEREHPGKDHRPIMMHITFCKDFDLKNSFFKEFQKAYAGDDFIFRPFYMNKDRVLPYNILGSVRKKHLKIKRRSEINKKQIKQI